MPRLRRPALHNLRRGPRRVRSEWQEERVTPQHQPMVEVSSFCGLHFWFECEALQDLEVYEWTAGD